MGLRNIWARLNKKNNPDLNDGKASETERSKVDVESEAATFDRDEWSHPIQFMLSLVGYAVGFSNISRFPYIVMENGGGAFLLPYCFFLVFCGIPFCYLEFTLGQYSGMSPVKAFNIAPLFKGLGWSMFLVSGIGLTYYSIIMAWVFYYFGMSFQWDLPWKSCNNTWNTPNCFSYSDHKMNGSLDFSNMTSSTTEFWLYNALEISPSIDVIGGINWKMFGCFFAAWTLAFLCLSNGIKTSGKVVYVTAPLPYIFLTIILIRGVTLEGSWVGLKFYLKPDWSKLKEMKIWTTAAVQMFFSLGPALGGLITMSSYNNYRRKFNRDAIILPLICGCTSIYGGLALFSVIGHMVHRMGSTDVASLMQSGPGLIFIAYPEALAQLPGAAIWTVLFFTMLITLGIDTQFSTLETMTSGLVDRFPNTIGKHKMLITLVTCAVQFALALILVTRAGEYYFQVFDWYATATSVIIIASIEVVCLSYVYGAKRLFDNVETMLGQRKPFTRYLLMAMWYGVTPVVTMIIFGSLILDYKPPAFSNGENFPTWAIILGWCLACVSIAPAPITAVVEIFKNRHNLRRLFRPTDAWLQAVEIRRENAQKAYGLNSEIWDVSKQGGEDFETENSNDAAISF